MIMTVKQDDIYDHYKVSYTTMEEFEEDKRIFNLTLIDTEYMLVTYFEERECIRKGYLPE